MFATGAIRAIFSSSVIPDPPESARFEDRVLALHRIGEFLLQFHGGNPVSGETRCLFI
jgi:hypothetical protein